MRTNIIYNPSASNTSHDLGKGFTLTSRDGSTVYGGQYTDDVTGLLQVCLYVELVPWLVQYVFLFFPTKRSHGSSHSGEEPDAWRLIPVLIVLSRSKARAQP